MPQTLIRYPVDKTGVNPDNRVKDEPHTLAARRIRAIAPVYGYFYVDSVLLIDKADNRTLVRGTDYVYTDLNQTLTQLTGKEVAGVILVINQSVSSEVWMDYNVYGDFAQQSNTSLVNLLGTHADEDFSESFYDILGRPATFVPSPHLHDLGDVYGFETVVFALEKIRNAIVWSDSVAVDSMLKYIDDYLNNLENMLNYKFDTDLLNQVIRYKNQFTKELVGLSKVQNLATATEEEGRIIASPDYRLADIEEDKYIATKALAGFKEVLYSQLVSAPSTNLGRSYGVIASPLKTLLLSMTNGARILLDTHANVKKTNIPYDVDCYPDPELQTTRWTILKISNNEQDRGGVLFGTSMTTGVSYIGVLKNTEMFTSVEWKRVLSSHDTDDIVLKLANHIADTTNPHKVRKHQVGLPDVENLPIVTKEDIICRKPVKKYMTQDAHLLFMKAFFTGVPTLDDIEDLSEEMDSPTFAERYQILFSPCGPCGDNYSNITRQPCETPAPGPIKPRGELLSAYCQGFKRLGRFSDGFGGSYEELIEQFSTDCGYVPTTTYPTKGTLLDSFCEETTLHGKYADGAGGYYTRPLEYNSSQCGNVLYVATYELRDLNNILIGLGYGPGDTADPAATVSVNDEGGVLMCRIYPQSGVGHVAEWRDDQGTILGYAVNPPTP